MLSRITPSNSLAQSVSMLLISLTSTVFAKSSHLLNTIAPLQKTATVAFVVTDLKKPAHPLLSLNESIYLQPASTMKILTSIIATDSLNHQMPFKTQLTGYGKQEKNQFSGNIVFEVGANPAFDDNGLDHLISTLKQKNIDMINGDIIMTKTHFDSVERIPGLVWDELDECYATAVSDISFNSNCFIATFNNVDGKIHMDWPQKNQPVKLDIQLADDCHDSSAANTHFPAYGYGIHLRQNPLKKPETLRGCWSKDLNHIQLKRSIHQPESALKAALVSSLRAHNITLSGKITETSVKPKALRNKSWQIREKSPDLYQLITKMLQKSDNHIAAHLFKESAYQSQKRRASWEDAQAHGQHILQQYKLDDDEASIVDGAGLSRNNRITANQLQSTLIKIYQTPKLKKLIKAFAHQDAIDSTLAKRLEAIDTPVYAKTGNLKGVMSLAGYIDPFGKHPKAFTIIINGNKSVGNEYMELERTILQQIIDM